MVSTENAYTAPSGVSPSYPPQNSLQAALHGPTRMDSIATINLDQERAPRDGQKTAEQDEQEALRLRGGCFSLEPCGCNADCCCIPCTIS
ncbi:hypothetical protein JCM8202_006129 [Rhodotorula sphaerocarpa]